MRKIFTIAILALTINAFAQIPTNGLIGYYPFNGNANDQSGFNHNGNCGTVALTTDRFGNANSAYYFSNNGSDTIGINITLPYGDFSFAFWFNADTIGDLPYYGPTPIDWRDYSSQNPLMVFTINPTDNIGFLLRDNTQPTTCINLLTPTTPIVAHSWYFITGTCQSNQMKLYENGQLIGTANYTQGAWTLNHLLLGNNQHCSNPYNCKYSGKLDDMYIYNRALTQAGVDSIYNTNLCYQTITVTDTLIINANLTGYNPVTFQNTIKIFPNPTNDHITINFGSNFSTMTGYTLKITNSLSQTMFTTPVNQQIYSVDLNTWTGNGIYFVHLIDASSNTIDIRKIVLQ